MVFLGGQHCFTLLDYGTLEEACSFLNLDVWSVHTGSSKHLPTLPFFFSAGFLFGFRISLVPICEKIPQD